MSSHKLDFRWTYISSFPDSLIVTAKTDDAITTTVNVSGSLASTRQQEAVIDNGSLPPDIEETLAELHPDAKCEILVDAIESFGENLILSDEDSVNSLLQIAANMKD